jgi:hypothetical protein
MNKTPLIGSEILLWRFGEESSLQRPNAQPVDVPESVTPSLVLDRREVTQKGQMSGYSSHSKTIGLV